VTDFSAGVKAHAGTKDSAISRSALSRAFWWRFTRRVRLVLFVESEAIETVAAFMTAHLLLKMRRVETVFYGLVSICGSAHLIAYYLFLRLYTEIENARRSSPYLLDAASSPDRVARTLGNKGDVSRDQREKSLKMN
jgi:hypothetical protein